MIVFIYGLEGPIWLTQMMKYEKNNENMKNLPLETTSFSSNLAQKPLFLMCGPEVYSGSLWRQGLLVLPCFSTNQGLGVQLGYDD